MKNIGKKKQVFCHNCGKAFTIAPETYDAIISEGRYIYCSQECGVNNKTETEVTIVKQEIIADNIENSFNFHFRDFINKNENIHIAYSDIKKQWGYQNGKCYFTDKPLKLTTNLSTNTFDAPMLIKKDKTKDLNKDNIIWVCKPIGLLSYAFNESVSDILSNIKTS